MGPRAGDFSPTVQLPPSSLWHGLGNLEIWGILKSPCSQTPCVCCPGELGREVLCGKNHLLILISALPLWAPEPPSLSSRGIGLNTASPPHLTALISTILGHEARRRAQCWNLGLRLGGVGKGLRRCAAGKFGSVHEDFVVYSHETHFLSLDFCPGGGSGGSREKVASPSW